MDNRVGDAQNREARRFTRGFTLLEILVVVLIISIVAGLATLAIRDNPERRLETEAQRIAALLRLASQEAVLQSRETAIEFESNGYRFLVLENGEWLQADDKVFRPRTLPDDMEFEIVIEGERLDFGSQAPARSAHLSAVRRRDDAIRARSPFRGPQCSVPDAWRHRRQAHAWRLSAGFVTALP
jgi:type II secretion system protein H